MTFRQSIPRLCFFGFAALFPIVHGTAHADEAQDKAVAFITNQRRTDVVRDKEDPRHPIVELTIDRSDLTNAALPKLAPLKSLHALQLSVRQMNGPGFKALAQLKNLRNIKVTMTNGRPEIKRLADLKHLESLNLGFAGDADSWIKEIACLKNLKFLTLHVRELTDAHVREFRSLKNLRVLRLGLANPPGMQLDRLARLRNLESLELALWQVTDAGLKGIGLLNNLRSLNLNHGDITDAGLKELAPLKSLVSLDLRYTRITDTGLMHLAPLKSLQSLQLSNTQVIGPGLKALTSMKNLHTLDLSGTSVTDAGMKYVAQLKNLRVLSLGGRVGDAGLKELLPLKDSLEKLHLPYKLTDAGFKELAKFKNLKLLRMGGCHRVSQKAYRELRKALPNCRIDSAAWQPRRLWRNPLPNSGKKHRATPAQTKKIATWIRDLGSSSFRKRESATRKLKETGALAVVPLLKVVDDTADLEVRLRAKQILDHLVKTYNPPDKNIPPKLLVLLAGQGQPATRRWAVKEIIGRYKDGVPGAKDLFKKLYPLFPGKRQQELLRGIDKRAEKLREMHAKLRRHDTYDLDSKILQQEEYLAHYFVDPLIKARGK